MHVVIINGSPRTAINSNTEKIIDAFAEGLETEGATYERYAISRRSSWKLIKNAYVENTEILIALPLYVENVPGLLLEFLEALPRKDKNTKMSFLLQSGFAEASQLRCGEAFLEKLTGYLGVSYGGTLVKGDNFGIRILEPGRIKEVTAPYSEMGKVFVKKKGFDNDEAKRFAGPEYFPLPIRILIGLMFKTTARKQFKKVSQSWGCKVPIKYKPWE